VNNLRKGSFKPDPARHGAARYGAVRGDTSLYFHTGTVPNRTVPRQIRRERSSHESGTTLGRLYSRNSNACAIKLEFHDADTDNDTDILARILADTSDALFPEVIPIWQVQRHADILATTLARMMARMSVPVSVSASWNASFTPPGHAPANS